MLALLAGGALSLEAQRVPAGWRTRAGEPPGTTVYEAGELPPGEQLSVRERVVPLTRGVALAQWLRDVSQAEAAPSGQWASDIAVSQRTANLAMATREFTADNGKRGAAMWIGFSADLQQMRFLRLTASSREVLRSQQGQRAQALMTELATSEITTARREGRPTAIEAAPAASANSTPRESPRTASSTRTTGERYEFVAAPGAGLRSSEIEAVFYEWMQVYEIGGLQFREALYLLLTDGTVRRGLPVAPQDLDVARSRRGEPTVWGRWRRNGAEFEFAFGAPTAPFRRKQGYVVGPAGEGVTLSGRYQSSSSYQVLGGASAWSVYGVIFSPGARFEITRTGGAGGTTGAGDAQVTAGMAYDDSGSSSAVSSSTFGGGSTRRTPDRGDRRGTYRIDGHAIILTFENGTVERLPFVVQRDASRRVTGVWMLGSLLSPPRK